MSGRDHTYPSGSTPTASFDQASADHQDMDRTPPSSGDADDPWARVTSRMRQDIGEAAWRNWIKPLRVSRLEDGTLTLEANSTLARERVTSQYADRLRVNAETGEWTGSVLYLPDGSELIFEKDAELQFEISAPGYQNFNLAYKVRKRKNVVPVTLQPMDMTDINDEEDEEVIIGFGRDRPIER